MASSGSGGRLMKPGQRGHVVLELQDGQERLAPNAFDSEPRSCQHLAILSFDPVVKRETKTLAEQHVDEAPWRCGGGQEAGDHDVGIHHP